MFDYEFNQIILFIENLLERNIDSIEVTKELLKTYNLLIKQRTKFFIEWLNFDESIRKELIDFNKIIVKNNNLFDTLKGKTQCAE